MKHPNSKVELRHKFTIKLQKIRKICSQLKAPYLLWIDVKKHKIYLQM